MSAERPKDIDLSHLKYNLKLHLGKDKIKEIEQKENVIIRQSKLKKETENQNKPSNKSEQNSSLIHYYLKEL